MKFTKMHGIGNDYVYVDCFNERVDAPEALAVAISDRHIGVGSDGLILICPSNIADVKMRMFNADGSESEMCGNGVRCVAKYALDHGLTKNNPLRVETGAGVLMLQCEVEAERVTRVRVDMGAPILDLPKIPVDDSKLEAHVKAATFVSMGNPHAVFFVDDVKSLDLQRTGPPVENHSAFPRRINAHWVRIHSKDEVTMRTWERGSGITLACGTGACAVCVAGALTERTNRKILAHLPGGDLTLEWSVSNGHVYMTGPAVEVFSGDWSQ